jgi:hypothetical protein
MEIMAKHLIGKHKNEAIALRQDVDALYILLSGYLLATRYVRIPPEETGLLKAVTEGNQALLNLFAEDVKPVG